MSNYITLQGMQNLQKKLKDLIAERPQVIEAVVTARELGDLSENAEYHAARERQRQIESEADRIKTRMAYLKVIDPNTLSKDAIRFGAYVKLEESESGTVTDYQLVGVDEVYERPDGITPVSVESPLGKAMVGKRVGQPVSFVAPIGVKKFKVLSIS